MKRLVQLCLVLALLGAGIFWFLTAPKNLSADELASTSAHTIDLENGENLFWAGGCASCHAAPGASGDDKKLLSGGLILETEFGGFAAPNISPNESAGIGAWSFADFANAMKRGISPDGKHYYPAFPFASYTHMPMTDLADLFAYMQELPSSDTESKDSEIGFPFNVRRGLGLWKLLYLDDTPVISEAALGDDPILLRGRYLVEGPGHCGECHTERTLAGGMNRSKWLEGAPNPEGKGRVPGITNSAEGLADWSDTDIAYALETGFTPEFDSLGSSMADVVLNYANVKASDREAIAAYLKHLSPDS